jgi:hypothetical protein
VGGLRLPGHRVRAAVVAADALPPEITHLILKPDSFKGLSSGGSIVKKTTKDETSAVTYSDSKAARTKFRVFKLEQGYKIGKGPCKPLPTPGSAPKHSHPCTRDVFKGSFSRDDSVGSNSFDFSGRVGGHQLSAGSYELDATPKLGILTGKTVPAKFEIG